MPTVSFSFQHFPSFRLFTRELLPLFTVIARQNYKKQIVSGRDVHQLIMSYTTILISSIVLFAQFSDALFNVVGSTQTVTVTGRLVCQGQPAGNVLVKMYEDGTS